MPVDKNAEQRLRQALESQAQGRGDLDRIHDAAILGARNLEMSAAHVPSDHDAHVPFVATAIILP